MRGYARLKTLGTPEDMGLGALFLASDASRFITGQIVRPNGGTAMPWERSRKPLIIWFFEARHNR